MNLSKRQIKEIILQKLSESFQFEPDDNAQIKGIKLEPAHQPGRLFRKFKLSNCRLWCELNENFDMEILDTLNALAVRKKIKILDVSITRDLHWNDILFWSELGLAVVQPRKNVFGFEFVVKQLYWDKPFPAHQSTGCKMPLNEVKRIREKRDEFFRKRFGQSNELEVEKELHHETLLANTELANAQISIAKKLDKLVNK
jgi:hypothetical protein